MPNGTITQCKALTKSKTQCMNHVNGQGHFCELHKKKLTVKTIDIVREKMKKQMFSSPFN
jgi:hypothetical protein